MLQTEFKQAMRRLAATVSIVTSGNKGERAGIAATAVTSICMEPPTLLVSINRSSRISDIIDANGVFCINILSRRHKHLVEVFGGYRQDVDRFSFGNWNKNIGDIPFLEDAAAVIFCRIIQTFVVGTHSLHVGQVEKILNDSEIDPLIWFDGQTAVAQHII